MSARDPRTDPRPGDVVRKGRITRTVIDAEQAFDRIVTAAARFVAFRNGNGKVTRWWGLGTWEAWADGAVVVTAAPAIPATGEEK